MVKLGNVRMPDQGAAMFIELFTARPEGLQIQDVEHINALRFWSLGEIDEALATAPDTFTTTFPYVYQLFLAATRQPR